MTPLRSSLPHPACLVAHSEDSTHRWSPPVRTPPPSTGSPSTLPSGHPRHIGGGRPPPLRAPTRTRPSRWRRSLRGTAIPCRRSRPWSSAAGCYAPAPSVRLQVASPINAAFGDLGPGVVACMTNIAGRESGFRPRSCPQPGGAGGLFQILLPSTTISSTRLGVDPRVVGDPRGMPSRPEELWNSSGIAPWGHC